MEKRFSIKVFFKNQINFFSCNSFVIFFTCLAFLASNAQDLEPRVYANLPKNMNSISEAYVYIDGNVVVDPSIPVKDFTIQSHNFISAYVRTFSLAKKLARVQVVLPYIYMQGSAIKNNVEISDHRSGIADMRIRFGINLIGSPALDLKEFMQYKQKTIFGASLVTSIPTGNYLNDKVVNIGTNRWAFKPEVGVSRRLERIYLESYFGVWFYTNNNDYLGNQNVEQNPAISFQFHSSYYFKNNMWVGLNLNWYEGGSSTIDGVDLDNPINNWRVGATYSTPIGKGQTLKLQFHIGANKTSNLNYDAISLAYNYSFF